MELVLSLRISLGSVCLVKLRYSSELVNCELELLYDVPWVLSGKENSTEMQ